VITDRYPDFCRHQLVELGYLTSAHVMTSESVAFNVQPRATGQLLIGSSRELSGWDASINRAVLRKMLARAEEFMPAIARLRAIRVWTGFRPATPDKLPLIGRWEATPGLWIASGHEGLGITTSLGTAQILADMIVGKSPAIDPIPFAPARALASTSAVH
jgi:glycine/D-amino acid oxidase-like deaminating enzyme